MAKNLAENGVTELVTKEDMLNRPTFVKETVRQGLINEGVDAELAQKVVDAAKIEEHKEEVMNNTPSKMDVVKATLAVKALQVLTLMKKVEANIPSAKDLGKHLGNTLNHAQKSATTLKSGTKSFFADVVAGYKEARKQ